MAVDVKFSHEYNAAVHKNETLKKRGVVDFSTPETCAETYGAGFVGSICDPEGMDRLVDDGLCPTFEDVAGHLQRDYGGTNALLYQYVLKLDPRAYEEKQTTGDCHKVGTMVRMADGTEKPIESIRVGEYVLSALSKPRRVLRTIRKPYSGPMIDVQSTTNRRKLSCTPNHLFFTLPGVREKSLEHKWVPCGELSEGDMLLVPHGMPQEALLPHEYDLLDATSDAMTTGTSTRYGYRGYSPGETEVVRQKNGRSLVNRFVRLDERLGWLLGLFAAEGSVDMQGGKPLRITLNLSKHERLIAEQAAQIVKDIFGVECRIYQVPSKPSVLYVRCHSGIVAAFFKRLVPGNVWSKRISGDWFNSPRGVRLAFVRGWMDGDGHMTTSGTLTGASVSESLAASVYHLAVSCGLKASLLSRKGRGRTKACWTVNMPAREACTLYPERQWNRERVVRVLAKSSRVTSLGHAVPVRSLEKWHMEDGFVYCLEVEHDHSFVANGFAVHNCVSHGTRNAVDCARAVEILLKGEPEEWVARGATEAIYGCRGHGGQGMSCDQATRFVASAGGILLRLNYPDLSLDLSRYNASIGTGWGRSGVPANVVAEAKKHQAVYSARITSVEGAIAALSNGYGVHCCSGMGFAGSRDDSGFSDPRGSWAHDMACVGHASEGLREEGFLIQNSWGAWNSGPTKLGQAPGSFWVTKSVMARLIAANGTFAVGNVRGWPARSLPDLGSNWQPWMTPA